MKDFPQKYLSQIGSVVSIGISNLFLPSETVKGSLQIVSLQIFSPNLMK
jgi:hypothetical protein